MEKVEENTHDDRRGGGSRGGCGVWCIVIHASAQWDEWPCWVANELSSTLVQFGNEMGDPKRMLVASRFVTMMVPLLRLVGTLVLLVCLGTLDAVDYNINGMLFMCQYRAALNVIVVFASSIFFFSAMAVDRARRVHNGSAAEQQLNSPLEGATSDPNTSLLSTHSATMVPTLAKRHCASRAFWFLLAAVFDTISLYISMLASNTVSSTLRSILQQATIPFSMIASYVILGRRYGWGHMMGALLIIVGIVVCLITVIVSTDQTSDPLWGLVYTLSCVPLALGACLKEWIMTHPKRPDDIHTVNAATVGFQLLLSIILYPAAVLIQYDSVCLLDNVTVTNATISHLFENLWEGVTCGLAGVSTVPNATAEDQVTCGYAVMTTWLAIITICAFNVVMLWVIKYGSGVLYFVSTAAVIPIVSLISTSSWYSSLGLEALAFSVWQLVGLVVVVVGCCVYVYFLRRDVTSGTQSRRAARSMKDVASEGQFAPAVDEESFDEGIYEEWDQRDEEPVQLDEDFKPVK